MEPSEGDEDDEEEENEGKKGWRECGAKVQRRREQKPPGFQLAESKLCAKTAWA